MTPDHRHSNSFLRRNIAHVVHSLTNGTFGSPSPGLLQQSTTNGDHPRKRRRVSSPERSALNIDHLIASPSKSSSEPTLRIELLKLSKRDSKKVRPQFNSVVTPEITTKAICRMSVFERSQGFDKTVYCHLQECEIVAFKNPAGPNRIARIHLEHPFYVPRRNLQICGSRDLADSYGILVELESSQYSTTWPPLDAADLGVDDKLTDESNSSYWRVEGISSEIFGRLKVPVRIRDTSPGHHDPVLTDYDMDLDLRWTSGFQTLRRLEAGSKYCITAIDPEQPEQLEQLNGDVDMVDMPLINGDTDHTDSPQSPQPGDDFLNGSLTPSKSIKTRDLGDDIFNGIVTPSKRHADSLNGDVTPSRSLRVRGGEKNYNLKKLSDQAHGTQRRRRKPAVSTADFEGKVSYFLPSEQPMTLDYFRCISCGAYHQSLQLLQLHLNTHIDHEYKLETTSQGPQFHVKVRPPSGSPSKAFHLGQPTKEFKLESFLYEDHSWLQSRIGSDSVKEFIGEAAVAQPPPPLNFKIPRVGKQGLPSPTKPKGAAPTTADAKNISKVLIPKSNYTFFHPVSKQELKMGDEVPFAPAEKGWLYHKHRETLNESQNLTAAELEYIKEFDSCMKNHNISARAYFPPAWLDFVKTKASWLVTAKYRMNEFALHQSYLIASQLLKDEDLDKAIVLIEEARRKRREDAASTDIKEGLAKQGRSPRPTPRTPPIRPSAGGCGVCGLPVLCGPDLLLCNGTVCFHASIPSVHY